MPMRMVMPQHLLMRSNNAWRLPIRKAIWDRQTERYQMLPVLHPVCCSGLIGVTPWSLEIPTPCAHRVGNAWEDWRSWDKSDSQWKISDAKLEAESVKNIRERYQWKISDATTQPYALSYYLPCLPNLWSSFASTAGSRPPTKCKILQRHLPLQSINQNQSSLRRNSHDRKQNRARQTDSMTMGVASLF